MKTTKEQRSSSLSIVHCEIVDKNLIKSFDLLLTKIKLNELIKPKEKILIKPNLCAPLLPSSGGITKPLLVVYLAEKVKKLGAIPIIAEGAIGYGITEKAFKASGLAALCQKKGIKLISLDNDQCTIKNIPGKKLKKVKLAAIIDQVDKIINFPVLKTHLYTQATLSLKNLLGLAWRSEKSFIHREGIDQGLADLNLAITPILNIIDGTIGMEGEGPTRGTPKKMGLLLASLDRVALDSVGCRLMGISQLPTHIKLAEKNGLGTTQPIFDSPLPLEKLIQPFKAAKRRNLNIDRVISSIISHPLLYNKVFKMSRHQKLPTLGYPLVNKKLCDKCDTCISICPFKALSQSPEGYPKCNHKSCLKCYACVEICPTGALRESI